MTEELTVSNIQKNLLLDKNLILSYKGVLDNYLISILVNHINHALPNNADLCKKIINVFIELSQNVLYYSEERQSINDDHSKGVGMLELREEENHFSFTSSNLVKNHDSEILRDRCDLINSLNRDELRELKRKQRREVSREKIGSNIGLIQVALVSANYLEFTIIPFNDKYSYFVLKTIFDKN